MAKRSPPPDARAAVADLVRYVAKLERHAPGRDLPTWQRLVAADGFAEACERYERTARKAGAGGVSVDEWRALAHAIVEAVDYPHEAERGAASVFPELAHLTLEALTEAAFRVRQLEQCADDASIVLPAALESTHELLERAHEEDSTLRAPRSLNVPDHALPTPTAILETYSVALREFLTVRIEEVDQREKASRTDTRYGIARRSAILLRDRCAALIDREELRAVPSSDCLARFVVAALPSLDIADEIDHDVLRRLIDRA